MTDEVIWTGAEALRSALVSVDEIRPHDRNPRVGDIPQIKQSLQRWGQVRAILVDADGRIIAGNHKYLAAVALGWTHVAVIRHNFESASEADDFLLADNRLADLGGYERDELLGFLRELEATEGWKGTGYTEADLTRLAALGEPMGGLPGPAVGPAGLHPEFREVVLHYTDEQAEQFSASVRTLRASPTEGVTATVLAAVAAEAYRLNQETS